MSRAQEFAPDGVRSSALEGGKEGCQHLREKDDVVGTRVGEQVRRRRAHPIVKMALRAGQRFPPVGHWLSVQAREGPLKVDTERHGRFAYGALASNIELHWHQKRVLKALHFALKFRGHLQQFLELFDGRASSLERGCHPASR